MTCSVCLLVLMALWFLIVLIDSRFLVKTLNRSTLALLLIFLKEINLNANIIIFVTFISEFLLIFASDLNHGHMPF